MFAIIGIVVVLGAVLGGYLEWSTVRSACCFNRPS